MLIKDLFVNLAIIVAVLFFYSQVSIKFPLHANSSIKVKILTGLMGGILSNILMQYSIHVGTTLIDLRHVSVIMLAYYGGAIPALVAMILTVIGRFFIAINMATYLAIILNLTVTIFSIYISKRNFSKQIKVITMIFINNIVFSAIICYLLQDLILLITVLPIYWVVSYLGVFLAFYVLEYIRKSQALFRKYQCESITDGLTGLNNVRKFTEVFNELVYDVKAYHQQLVVLYIDIDHFKRINDTYGHLEGDIVLKEVALRLRKNTKSFDIVSRNGGEEFTILLIGCPLNRGIEIAERIRHHMEVNPIELSTGEKINLTVSIGIAAHRETTDDPEMLIHAADQALYQAKSSGRNKVCVADQ